MRSVSGQDIPIGEPIFSSPAIADGKILIRSEKTLFCISKKRDQQKAGGNRAAQ